MSSYFKSFKNINTLVVVLGQYIVKSMVLQREYGETSIKNEGDVGIVVGD